MIEHFFGVHRMHSLRALIHKRPPLQNPVFLSKSQFIHTLAGKVALVFGVERYIVGTTPEYIGWVEPES
jgi:hypothetical protein